MLRSCLFLFSHGTLAGSIAEWAGFLLRVKPRHEKTCHRFAEPSEAEVLTRLAMTAKASWGYSDAFMEACGVELTMISHQNVGLDHLGGRLDGTIYGMIAVNFGRAIGNAELEDFFVDPVYQGRGVGWALMSVVFQTCRSRSVRVLGVDADPNSGKFTGDSISDRRPRAIAVNPGRALPKWNAHNRGLRRS